MSREQLEQARQLIKERRFDDARAILRTLVGNPTAEDWLRKLDAMTGRKPPSEEEKQEILERAGGLIKQKQIGEARALLKTIRDDPKAKEWLARLDKQNAPRATSENKKGKKKRGKKGKIAAVQKKKPASADDSSPELSATVRRRMITMLVVLLLVAVVLVVVLTSGGGDDNGESGAGGDPTAAPPTATEVVPQAPPPVDSGDATTEPTEAPDGN